MALSPISKDDLRERIDTLEVIGRYVRLQKAGNEYRGLCPFHTEKTPSFYVNAEKGVWFCRGACGTGGDVFKFVQLAEKLEFIEAAELLANQLGCTIRTGREDVQRAGERDRTLEICRLAASLYERALWQRDGGQVARDYLRDRGLTEATIKRFHLGYAPPGWDQLTRYLQRHDIPLREADAAGLLKRREHGDGYYDRFRGRVMFPILDAQGRTVGFGGRVIDPHDEPKYLNSPETASFSKGRLLYGLPFAVEALRDGAIVVEGYMDVIALHQHGVQNAVATLGTSLTAEHLKLLRRHTTRVTLCYDGDQAGTRATDRAAAAFIQEGMDGRVLSLPHGQDPDEFVRAEGQDAFRALLEATPDLVDYRLRAALASADDEAGRSQAILDTVVSILGDIRDEVRQAQYVRRIADWWSGVAVGLQEEFERTLTRTLRERHQTARRGERARDAGRDERPAQELLPDRGRLMERRLVRLLLHCPHLTERVGELSEAHFDDSACRRVLAAIRAAGPAGSDAVLAALDENGRTLAADLMCQAPDPAEDLERIVRALDCLALEREAETVRRQRDGLAREDFEAQARLYKEWIALQQRLDSSRRALHNAGGML